MNYNIFDVYRKGSKELLANNIAILKNDTFKNRFLQSGNSLNIKIRKNLNKALDKFSNDKKVNVPDNWKIYDQINKDSERFKKYNKNVLINIFKDELKKIASCPEMIDEEKITSIILDKAVLRYDINKNKPNRVKSKLIIKKYKQEMLEKISKKLKNASDEEKEMIKKELKIDNLTGEAIRKILINSGGPISLMALVQISGFSSYILLTSIMHASASLLGITLPFAAYTGATTSLAFLSSPLSILLASGLGGWAFIRSSKKFNELLLIRIISNSQIIIKEKTELLEQKYKMNYLETKSSRPLLIEGKPKNIDPDNISNKKSESFESILDNNKWLKWVNDFNDSSINKLKRELKNLNKMDHEWNIEYLTLFNEKFTDIITNDDDYDKEKQILLENYSWKFGNYITNITDYFSQKNKLLVENEEIYLNLICSITEFTYNKTEKTTKSFIKLNEKILKQIPRTSQSIFQYVFEEWFGDPSFNMSTYFLDMLELFDDYGCSREKINVLWIQWMGKLEKNYT